METQTKKLDWIDALKAFALLGILLNHAVESFQSYPWFSNPSSDWPEFAERMANIFPKDGSFFIRLIQFLGWLGDMGSGVFIFVSGLTLTISALNKPVKPIDFYKSRALRIYPLYIATHIIIIILAYLFSKPEGQYFLLKCLISITGLRFTNGLFGFLNPSWWFIWFILQMYLFFPFLLILLKRKGVIYFLVTTFAVTIFSRALGVLGFTFSVDLYSWMTGLFGGTRLFEFTFGMYIGFLHHNKNIKLSEILNKKYRLLLFFILVYLVGFVASWTYIGSIISNLLITIGLSGIFYSIYELIIKGNKTIQSPLLWIGKNSFSVFLLHQPFLIYFSTMINGYSKVIIFILVIISSMIAGHLIEKIITYILNFMTLKKEKIYILLSDKRLKSVLVSSILLFLFASFLFMLGLLNGHHKLIKLVLLLQILTFISYRVIFNFEFTKSISRKIDLYIILSAVILILPENWFCLFWFFILVSWFILVITNKLSHYISIAISLLLITLTSYIFELNLRKNSPVEVGQWGEFPALQTDNETAYSLIPKKTTKLKYNNYNYTTRTNRYGFNSPEIDLISKTENEIRILIIGDAFSMPEGVDYDYSYSALLEKKLKIEFPEQKINVINAGVTGYGPNEELAQLNKYIGLIQPDIIINQLFVNEFSDINDSKASIRKSIGFSNPSSLMQRFLVQAQLPRQASNFFRNLFTDNNNLNYKMSLISFYEKKSSYYNDTIISKLNAYLEDLKHLTSLWKSELIILTVPGQIEISEPKYISYYPKNINLYDSLIYDLNLPHKFFQKLCYKNQIKLLEIKNSLIESKVQPLYFEKSWHWNKDGHALAAEFLFQFLKVNKIFKRSLKNDS